MCVNFGKILLGSTVSHPCDNNVMHTKPDLRVFLKWLIACSGSVITAVITFSCSSSAVTCSSLWSRFGSVSRSARSTRQHARASAVDVGLSKPGFVWILFALPRLIRYAWCHRRGRSAPGTSLWFSRARWSGKPSHKLP